MARQGGGKGEGLTIFWNGRPIEARAGESAAAALNRAGIRGIGCSRKFHRPLSGDLALGLQAQLDGVPNVRLDRLIVQPGMRLGSQNVWPSPRFDLLQLARLVPRRWLRGGFEHPRALPSGSRRFEIWERLLRYLAGGGDAIAPSRQNEIRPGKKIAIDVAVIGGGPAGRRAAIAAAGGPGASPQPWARSCPSCPATSAFSPAGRQSHSIAAAGFCWPPPMMAARPR